MMYLLLYKLESNCKKNFIAEKSFLRSQYVLKTSLYSLLLSKQIKTLARFNFFVFDKVTNEQKDKNKCVCS